MGALSERKTTPQTEPSCITSSHTSLGAQIHTVLENKKVSTAHEQQAAELGNVHSNEILPALNIREKAFQ
eukprot:7833466-Lingulodinium_polyedra.AAC.1